MPTKLNRAGQQQEYVPAGNGDASGEYGDSTGSNKHFESFSKEKVYTQKNGLKHNEKELKKVFVDDFEKILKEKPYYHVGVFMRNELDKYSDEDSDAIKSLLLQYKDEFLEMRKKAIDKRYDLEVKEGKEVISKLPKIEGNKSVDDNIIDVNSSKYASTRGLSKIDPESWKKWHMNCQICAQAFEARMRGIDIKAAPRPEDGSEKYKKLKENGWTLAMFVMPKDNFEYYGSFWFLGKYLPFDHKQIKRLRTNSVEAQKQDIKDIVKEAGPGARFMCSVGWQGSRDAHVFNIINDNGEVRFVDAQSGDRNCEYYFRKGNIKTRNTMLIRVDNLEINKNILEIMRGNNNEA